MENHSKQTILIADDSEMNRDILSEMLGSDYLILEAENGKEAIALLQEHLTRISIVLLDINMPEMDGFDVLRIMRQQQWIEEIPVIMISAENRSDYIEEAYRLGVTDFIGRPFDMLVVRHRVVNTLLLYSKQKRLTDMVVEQIQEKTQQNSLMIDILSHIVEFRNGESGQHVLHIRKLTEMFLQYLNRHDEHYHFSPEEITRISIASAIHDVGKIAIPAEILNKPGRLTEEEFAIMKTHSTIGATMLQALPVHQEEPLVHAAYEICRWHHERYDGRGYPDGLKGNEIPIAAQIVSLADVYDALTCERVYKKALSHETAVQMILDGKCGAFNPVLLECFRSMSDQIQSALRSDNPVVDSSVSRQTIADEIYSHEELSTASQTLQGLELEREKNRFFSDVTEETHFEYTISPPILSLSSHSAHKLGLPDVIVDPQHNEALLSVSSPDSIRVLGDLIRGTSVENPVVEYDGYFKFDGAFRPTHAVCRAMWSKDEPPRYLGAIGRITRTSPESGEHPSESPTHDALTGLFTWPCAANHIRERLQCRPWGKYMLAIADFSDSGASKGEPSDIAASPLQSLAEQLRLSIRSGDIIAREEGNRLALFLEHKGQILTGLRRIFRELNGAADKVGLSLRMGAVDTEGASLSFDVLLARCQKALQTALKSDDAPLCLYNDQFSREEDA